MAVTRYEAVGTRIYDAPRALVWAIVSDSNRSDRALGLAAAQYRWERRDDGGMLRVARARELGLELEWFEPPYEWVEGRSLDASRTFIKGPVAKGGFSLRLEDASDGRTELVTRAYVGVEGPARFVIGPVQRMKFRRALERYLDEVGQVLAGWRELDAGHEQLPAAVRAQHLLTRSTAAMAVGPRTATDEVALARRAERLREAGVSPEVAERLVAHLRERPDDELTQMRPFELARLWGLDRREVLRGFLHATVAGLTDLRWQINCPVCRVGASVVNELSAVEETSHCAACQIHYDTDFAKHVEAVFPCNEAVRAVTPALYCASSPAFLPHVLAQLGVDGGATREERVDLPEGSLHVRVLGRSGGADVDVPPGVHRLEVRVDEAGLTLALAPHDGPSSVVELTSSLGERAMVLLERAGWSADAVLGSVVSSFPEFVDLFATEAPARGVDLRVGHLALLFTDLVGSTALYQRVGDARAFAIVEEHFRVSGEVIGRSGGAIVKTMGDAIMASFPSLPEAVAAARAMVEGHEAVGREHGLGVKIGVHAGPCLAVRANDRLDFFGTTVNLAARLQAQAHASEVVLTRESYDDPRVRALLEGMPARRFTAALKGIQAVQDLVGVDCGPADVVAAAG
jgi:class 3 adenylate cyclase